LNWLDIVIALIVTIPAFLGFRRGFLRKLMGIAGLIIGFVLAVRFYKPVSDTLLKIVNTGQAVSAVLSFLLIIAVVFSLTAWIATFFAHKMNPAAGFFDRLAGAAFGFLQGILIASILVFNLTYLNFPAKEIRDASVFYSRVYPVAPAVFDRIISLSPSLKSMYEEYKQKFLNVVDV
jgi:membrane protein required for colicin V production